MNKVVSSISRSWPIHFTTVWLLSCVILISSLRRVDGWSPSMLTSCNSYKPFWLRNIFCPPISANVLGGIPGAGTSINQWGWLWFVVQLISTVEFTGIGTLGVGHECPGTRTAIDSHAFNFHSFINYCLTHLHKESWSKLHTHKWQSQYLGEEEIS